MPEVEFRPKTAIVTGGSRGIGEQVARLLAQRGHPVVIDFASIQSDADRVVQDIHAEGGRAVAVQANISLSKEVKYLFDRAEEEFGPVGAIVNSAGVNTPGPTPLIETDDDTYGHIYDVNARGTFNLLREAGVRMCEGGRIVNVSSCVIRLKVTGHAAYAGSKAAIEAMSMAFAQEMKGRRITVNCVAPGPTATEFFYQGKSNELIESYARKTPLGRLAEPREIAQVIAFLIGPDGGWVNGQIIDANGGLI
jgi:3-oxoacyl-[acyl-carrier protein] reductase